MRYAWLFEVLTSPPVYWATIEDVTDAAGNIYEERIPETPVIRRSLTNDFYGVRDDGDLTLDVGDVDGAVSVWLAAGERLGVVGILRRKNLDTNAISDRFYGKIEQHVRAAKDTVRLVISDQETATLTTPYPRLTVTAERYPTATSEEFALDGSLPIVLGATREHVPCRYIEAVAARSRFRYVAACDLAQGLGIVPTCIPAINAVYRGTSIGAALVGEGEYSRVYDRWLDVLTTPSVATAGAGSLNGQKWWAVTVSNGAGETIVSARGTLAGMVTNTARVTWTPIVFGARGSWPVSTCVYRSDTVGGPLQFLAEIAGGDATSFDDDGTLTPDSSRTLLTLAAALIGAGSLNDQKWWAATVTDSAGTIRVSDRVTAGVMTDQTARLTWTPTTSIMCARVYRADTIDGPLQFLAEITDGAVTYFDDNGTLIPDATRIGPTANQTGQHTVDLLFDRPQFAAQSVLAPVLADIECTELSPDDTTCGLWWFRRSLRDVSRHGNWLLPHSCTGAWIFDARETTTVPNHAGATNTLTSAGTIRVIDYHPGPWQSPVLHLAGGSWSSVGIAGLNPGTASFRIEAHISPDAGALDNPMTLMARWSGINGYELGLDGGALIARVGDGDLMVTIRGATKLQQAWHVVALIVDRTAQMASLYVDGVIDGSPMAIALIGSVSAGSTTTYVCCGPTGMQFGGLVEYVAFIPSATPTTYVLGKSSQSLNAIDFAAAGSEALVIPDARQSQLDAGTADFSLEAWVKLSAIGTEGTILEKTDSVNGYRLYVTAAGKVFFRMWRAGPYSQYAVGDLIVGTWCHVGVAVDRETAGADGRVTVALGANDTWEAGTTVIVAASPVSLDNAAAFAVGGRADGGTKLAGAIDEIRWSATTRTPVEMRRAWALGQQNPARQVRTLLESSLHGPDLAGAIDATTWNACDLIDPAIAKTGYALVEQMPLRDHLSELLRVRGYQIGLNAAGNWTCDVDAQRTPGRAFGWKDGVLDNIVERPTIAITAVKESIKKLVIKYRRRRQATGEVDKLVLRTSERDVMPVGPPTPVDIELAAVRDVTVGDRHAYYCMQRLILSRTQISFEAGEEALELRPGDVITLTDGSASSGITALPCEVRSVEEAFGVTLNVVPWSADIYGYVAGTLPTEPSSETQSDYSATYPPPVVGLTLDTPVVVTQADGRRVWSITARWTLPTTPNVRDAMVERKATSASAWTPAGSTDQTSLPIVGVFDDSTSYDVRVLSRNAFGLLGSPVVASVTTGVNPVPGDVTGFVQVALYSTVQTDGRRTWTVQLDWTNPSTPNIRVVISYKRAADSQWIEAVRTRRSSYILADRLDDSTTYDVRAVVVSHSGVESTGVAISVVTTTPSAPALPATPVGKTGGHRTRTWTWTANAEKNLEGYEWEVWSTPGPSGGSKLEPPTGQTRFATHARLVYQEANLAPTVSRYLRIRARNKSGVVSTGGTLSDGFSDRGISVQVDAAVKGSAQGGTSDVTPGSGSGSIGADDCGTAEFTDVHKSADEAGVQIYTSATLIASAAITMNGGVAVITVTGNIYNTASGGGKIISYQLKRGATPLTSLLELARITTDPWSIPYAIHYVDTTGPVGSQTYSLYMTLSASGPTPFANYSFSAIEFKR